MKIEQPFHTFRVVHHHSRFSYFSAQWFDLDSLGVKVVLKKSMQHTILYRQSSNSWMVVRQPHGYLNNKKKNIVSGELPVLNVWTLIVTWYFILQIYLVEILGR